MDEEARLNIQYEIIQFLSRRYYSLGVLDEPDCNDEARQDSYKIMKIIKEGIKHEHK